MTESGHLATTPASISLLSRGGATGRPGVSKATRGHNVATTPAPLDRATSISAFSIFLWKFEMIRLKTSIRQRRSDRHSANTNGMPTSVDQCYISCLPTCTLYKEHNSHWKGATFGDEMQKPHRQRKGNKKAIQYVVLQLHSNLVHTRVTTNVVTLAQGQSQVINTKSG